MGHGFGELYKGMRGIITYRISPFEQRAFAKAISHGVPNVFRRFRESVLYVAPPFILGWLLFDQTEKYHDKLMHKNPADYENDK